jgi:ketosteroid isomerase-like protein
VTGSGQAAAAVDVVVAMFHAVDDLDWETVRDSFTEAVDTDYTSLWGGSPERLRRDDLVQWWSDLAPGYDATHHFLGPFRTAAADDGAVRCIVDVRASHQVEAEGLAGTWLVAGRYTIDVRPTGGRHRIAAITLRALYEDGDRALVEVARRRIARGYGGRIGEGRAVDIVRRFYDLLAAKDLDAWAALWHDDARITVPYPPDGFASSIVGKDAIVKTLGALLDGFSSFAAELVDVHPAHGSETVCVEYGVRAVLRDGTEYRNENIAVFRFVSDLVVEYRDYFDPRRFQVVVDALS